MQLDELRQWLNDQFRTSWETSNGPAQSAYFMSCVLDNLPEVARAAIDASRFSIMDWGCAFGEGAAALKKAFPASDIVGVDLSDEAVAHAATRHPEVTFIRSDGVPHPSDVIVTSNCLEHMVNPLGVIREHLASCRQLYIVLVPYDEHPLMDGHRSQFREESFPEHLAGWTRLAAAHFPTNPTFWAGRQMLVLYGSPSFMAAHGTRQTTSARLLHDERLVDEVATAVRELLPSGGAVAQMQAALSDICLKLATNPQYRTRVLSPHSCLLTLAQARSRSIAATTSFAHEDFNRPLEEDDRDDLVIFADVDSISSSERELVVRRMAERARRYVMFIVPNSACYWYWVMRLQATMKASWDGPAVADPAEAQLEAAGLHVLGRMWFGSSLLDRYLRLSPDISDALRPVLELLHQPGSPIPPAQRGSYMCVLASAEPGAPVPAGWSDAGEAHATAMQAAIADSLAMMLRAQQALNHEHERIIPDWIALKMEINDLRARLQERQDPPLT
jgi:hypothetical protein